MSIREPIRTRDVLERLSANPGFRERWEVEAPKVTLAANVARLRAARGLTQQELAEVAGMRQPRIAEIERGDANPRLETLARIAGALGVPVDSLLAEHDDESADAEPVIALKTGRADGDEARLIRRNRARLAG
ncbi:MAG TPA: helix-turn-helix transcriptional regulator [Longimicrobium sp.]|nr:helix-turn-helix transcriptional regulator [Longimicrobium sp.]